MKTFEEWLKVREGTDSSSIAVFARPFLSGLVSRIAPNPIFGDKECDCEKCDCCKKKKKVDKK